MSRTWTIIVGLCTGNKDNHQTYFTIRETFPEDHYHNFSNLKTLAQGFARQGVSVVLRPNFNDLVQHGKVVGFREWRSFDGEPLKQVDFTCPGFERVLTPKDIRW